MAICYSGNKEIPEKKRIGNDSNSCKVVRLPERGLLSRGMSDSAGYNLLYRFNDHVQQQRKSRAPPVNSSKWYVPTN